MSPGHPLAAGDGWGPHTERESGILPGATDCHYFTLLTGKDALVTANAGRRWHEEA